MKTKNHRKKVKEMIELTIEYDGIFGKSIRKAWLKSKTNGKIQGWDYWIESSSGEIKKLTRGKKYLEGESLEDAIRNIEQGGEYTRRSVLTKTEVKNFKQ